MPKGYECATFLIYIIFLDIDGLHSAFLVHRISDSWHHLLALYRQ
ncbi:hypothetical protein NC653_040958 [Populus alba x Populus x berolinensis]|uniref:Uncharacterized protein n=1 Tax=Populus alba x Populus x berolinensis TaxID=444605 RepID=A0AAD6L7G0_9ROSI|nr:hypothetical protein NC653_040958 [Populus alba x Populus x berolinensis]